MFATQGLSLAFNKGIAFTSQEFHKFCIRNDNKHIRSTPCHQTSNGLAERAVQTLKGQEKLTTRHRDSNMISNLGNRVLNKQVITQEYPDAALPAHELYAGTAVWAMNFGSTPK